METPVRKQRPPHFLELSEVGMVQSGMACSNGTNHLKRKPVKEWDWETHLRWEGGGEESLLGEGVWPRENGTICPFGVFPCFRVIFGPI